MCGIAGFVARRGLSLSDLKRMTDAARHRGPDDEGYVCFSGDGDHLGTYGGSDTPPSTYTADIPYAPSVALAARDDLAIGVGLAHRRLSILDLSPSGHQPMCSMNRMVWLTYNGEVYNYVELRDELSAAGQVFATASDTEVIIAAYRQWGIEFLHRLNGMWALAIYDRRSRELILARDRFGIKPLYYRRLSGGGIAFASEIKQLIQLPKWRAKSNSHRVHDFLVHGISDHTSETMFDAVQQLLPGHFARISSGEDRPEFETVQWYRQQMRKFSGNAADAADAFRGLFHDSIRLQLRSDVPVGTCLSGGLDSSSIVCVVNEILRKSNSGSTQSTFSACAKVAQYDERKWIEKVVASTGVDAHYVYPDSAELFALLAEISYHQDEPFNSTSIFAQWCVFGAAARAGVKVMLDGQGGDETLAGYHVYFGAYLASLLIRGNLSAFLREARALRDLHGYGPSRIMRLLMPFLMPSALLQPVKKVSGYAHSRPAWLDASSIPDSASDPFRQERIRSATDLSQAQLERTNLPMLLHWEDRNSMAHSVEARVPFLDHRLVEFALGLPDDFKISGGTTKRVLRSAMEGVLPAEVQQRNDKLGFVTPEEHWVRFSATSQMRALASDAASKLCGLIRRQEFEQMVDRIVSGKTRYSAYMWRVISLAQWKEQFNVAFE
jgi:asparagine synthase (glutamine-hydrolysing)